MTGDRTGQGTAAMTRTKPAEDPTVTAALVAEHGLAADEAVRLDAMLGRTASWTELGIVSAMWSEHCSYKSSKRWLKTLPTTAPWVICGPGENAGVIDLGDGLAAVFKMESHNHPSFIEPYQGAATGVGGILRDVFTMGARPVANLNFLRFGRPEHPKTRHLVAGVVAGIGGYGNCVGVPTVGGATGFDPAYDGNILVNAMTVGVADANRIFYSAAAGVGNPVVYVGARTGRDGIHGATMASAEFSEDAEAKRPTVQVGDPFTEKLLIEACLELMATDAIVAIQDMGAAGLTSSAVEMAGKGGLGIELDLDLVPTREPGMTAYELMLSESQERMLMVLAPDRAPTARAIFEKWGLAVAEIGRLTDTGRLIVRRGGAVKADLELAPLVNEAPLYDRPWVRPPPPAPLDPGHADRPLADPAAALSRLLADPDLASKRWIWEQYDSQVGADTVIGPGGADAAVVRLHGTQRALAMTTDCTPRYCAADPETGGRQAVAEAWRNLCAVGARPLAVTDNLNFGNPEKPEIMGQLVGCIQGMAEACRALDLPVVSGNVSLYNETDGRAILPTPTIGAVGLIDDWALATGLALTRADATVLLVGGTGPGHLGQSLYLRVFGGLTAGPPPPVDLAAERRAGELIRTLIAARHISACHDLSDGGLLVALAEMALAGDLGVTLALPASDLTAGRLFGEDQGRYLVETAAPDAVLAAAAAAGVPARPLGRTGGTALTIGDAARVPLADLRALHEGWLPAWIKAT